MSKAVILQHVGHEGPGRIVPVFRDYGIRTEVRRLDRGDEVPTDLDEIRVVVLLGGPMGVADLDGGKHPFLAKEVDLLHRLVKLDRPVLGIGLGAQLLAHAAGAKVYPNVKMGPPAGHGQPPVPLDPAVPLPEVGWLPVQFPFPGGTEPMVMGMHDGATFFHWHHDTFDLPKLPAPPNPAPPPAPPPPTGNALLSSTKLCRNQAFRFKNRLFGFQYHVECDPAGIEAMLAHATDADIKAMGDGGIDKVRADTKKQYARYEQLSNRILANFVQFLKVY